LVSNPGSLDTWKGPYLSTGQDLSTTTTTGYTAAAYGLVYSNDLPAASVCSPDNTFLPLQVTSINGTTLAAGVDTSNTTFKELWKDMDHVTGTANAATTATGPVQFTVAADKVTALYVCMIAAQVN
jgi:hypothetical protein